MFINYMHAWRVLSKTDNYYNNFDILEENKTHNFVQPSLVQLKLKQMKQITFTHTVKHWKQSKKWKLKFLAFFNRVTSMDRDLF